MNGWMEVLQTNHALDRETWCEVLHRRSIITPDRTAKEEEDCYTTHKRQPDIIFTGKWSMITPICLFVCHYVQCCYCLLRYSLSKGYSASFVGVASTLITIKLMPLTQFRTTYCSRFTAAQCLLIHQVYCCFRFSAAQGLLMLQVYCCPRFTAAPGLLLLQVYCCPKVYCCPGFTVVPGLLLPQVYCCPRYTDAPGLLLPQVYLVSLCFLPTCFLMFFRASSSIMSSACGVFSGLVGQFLQV